MKTKRSKEEIAAEIAALRALVPVGPFASKTGASIEIAIETLRGEVDEAADEFEELTDDQRDAYYSARNWAEGEPYDPPSKDWGGLVA